METITIKAVNGIKDGKFAVLWKIGRKTVAWTQRWDSDSLWHNSKNGFSFSDSETLERAIWVMKEYLADSLDPFGTKKIIFETPKS